MKNVKTYLLILIPIFICFSFYFLFMPSKKEPQFSGRKSFIDLLEKTSSSEDRKKLIKENKYFADRNLSVELLLKARESFDEITLSIKRSRLLAEISMEVSEYSGDDECLAGSLLFYSMIEGIEKKDPSPASLKKALFLFRQKGNVEGEILCSYREAKNLYSLFGETEKARKVLRKTFPLIGKNNLLCGDYYYIMGRTYCFDGNMDMAVKYFNMALPVYEKANDIIALLSCYQAMSDICQSRGFLEEARRYLDISKKIIEKSEPDMLMNFIEKDKNYIFRGFRFEGKDQLFIDYYKTSGRLYSDTGKYDMAVKDYKKSIELASARNKISYSQMFSYWALSNIYWSKLKQKDMALKYYFEAARVSDRYDNIYFIVETYINIGNFYMLYMKQYGEAIKYFDIAIKNMKYFDDSVRKDEYMGLCTRLSGEAYMEKGDYGTAVSKLTEALNIFYDNYENYGRFDDYLVQTYLLLGKAYEKMGEKNKALDYMNKGLEFGEKDGKLMDICMARECLGNFYFSEGDYKKSQAFYLKAIENAKEIRSFELLWEYYYAIGKVYEKQNHSNSAYEAYKNAIDIIETMRQNLKIDEYKRDFMEDKINVYNSVIDLLVRMNRMEEAFSYSEKSRARAFLDILANQKIDIHHGVPKNLIVKEKNVQTRIGCLVDEIKTEKEKPFVAQRGGFVNERDMELNELKLEFQELLEQIKINNPEYMSFISVNPLGLEKIQKMLPQDTVLIEYFLGEQKSYAWIVGKKSFHTVIINYGVKDVELLVKQYRLKACDNMDIEKLSDKTWTSIAKKLYNIMFAGVNKYLENKKRLLIVPHRMLYYMPFQVLTDEKGVMNIERYEIAYLPSGSVLKYCKKKNIEKKDSIIAFEPGGLKIGDLPSIVGTEREVNLISSYFREKAIYSGRNMKTNILFKKGMDYDVLHFATHGILDAKSPLFSSLVFFDRRLNVYEIFDLNLKSYLVVLSACRTGLGEYSSGDELVSLSRAFIYAGTPTICASLWDVSDMSTSELMERFYFHLQTKNKTEAMRLAQLELMKKYKHPFFWSPFVIMGDWM